MAKVRSPWRLLRPLLLAGAVAATWLTLSSSAASADSSTESGSLLGGVTSSVSSLSAPLTGSVSPLLEPKSPAAPSGLLKPTVGGLANTADQLVAATPVVKNVVPSGTVSAVTVPVASAADGAVAGLAEVVVPPLVEAVPILEPVVQPVTGLVTGTTPLPAVLPEVLDPSVDLPGTVATGTKDLQTVPEPAETVGTDTAAAAAVVTVAAVAAATPEITPANAPTPVAGTPGTSISSADAGAPAAEDPSPSPVPAPAAPGSAAGGGSSPSGASGTAAWLSDFDLDPPLSGSSPISGASEHAPSPASFDPGSSPD